MKEWYSKEEVIKIKNDFLKTLLEDVDEIYHLQEENKKLKEENKTLRDRIEESEDKLITVYLCGYDPENE